jgi:mycoredoxin
VADQGTAITIYSTTWCGDCIRLKHCLDRSGVAYRDIDIERDESAADFVMRLNGGNQSVPTVVFDDGTVMSEPSGRQVLAHLSSTSPTAATRST